MRFRTGLALGGGIFGATLVLACFPDYYFFDRVATDGGEETSVRDAGRDASGSRDAADAFQDVDARDARDAPDANPPDAPVEGG